MKSTRWKKKIIMQPPTIFIPTSPVDHPHSHTHGRYEELRPSQFSLKKTELKVQIFKWKNEENKTNKKIIRFFLLAVFFFFAIIILSRMAGYFFKYLLNGKCDVFF